MFAKVCVVALLSVVNLTVADIYLHGPRGSNDRNCEKNVNRNNGNRMFDSQNNAKGGYACPRAVGGPERGDGNGVASFISTATTEAQTRMYYYEGSMVTVEWTSQHGCGGNGRVQCQMVIQYACEDTLDPYWSGDGTTGWPAPANGGDCPGNPNKAPGGPAGQCFVSQCDVAAPRDGIPQVSHFFESINKELFLSSILLSLECR